MAKWLSLILLLFLSVSIEGQPYNVGGIPRSAAEIAAGITPTSAGYGWPIGNPIRYGADPTGVNDSTAALNAACKMPYVSVSSGTYLTVNGMTCNVTQQVITFQGGALLEAPSGFSGTYVLIISGASTTVYNAQIDAGAALGVTNAGGIQVAGYGAELYSPNVVHFATNGIALNGTAGGDTIVRDSRVQQWLSSDSQYSSDGNFTANAIYVNRADCYVMGGIIRWSGVNIYADAAAANIWIMGAHFYNGRQGSARSDPINVHVAAGASGIFFQGDYFDNGHVDLFSPIVSIRASYFLLNSGATFTDSNYVRLYANGQTAPFQFDFDAIQVNLGSTNLLAYLPNGPNNWTGDWTGLSTVINGTGYQNVRASSGAVFLQNHADQSVPALANYKPSGTVNTNVQIGAATPSSLVSSNTQSTLNTNIFTVANVSGTNSEIQLGGYTNSSYLYDDGSSDLFLGNITTDRIELVSSGVLRPAADETYSLASLSNRATALYLGTGTPGTPTVSVSGSATTGAQSATFTATNKPGSGTTAPTIWLPVQVCNPSCTTYYTPLWQ